MAVSEVPLSITEPKSHTSYDYFAHKYGHKTAVEYKDDLNAIDNSLHAAGSPKMKRKTGTRRHKKAKRFPSLTLVPNLEDISENESLSLELEQKSKDLAEIHKERAISSGNYARQEGRSFRHKKYHKTPQS